MYALKYGAMLDMRNNWENTIRIHSEIQFLLLNLLCNELRIISHKKNRSKLLTEGDSLLLSISKTNHKEFSE